MPKPLRAMLLVAALATIAPVAETSAQAPAPEGRVNFTKAAESSFDRYTLSPSEQERRWMAERYWRMRTYAPYFDTRTAWYPGAWAYKDAYAIYRDSSLASQRPDWILKDAAGRRLYIPFACDGSTCTQYAADIGSPEWRRHYIDAAKRLIERGYKGIFVDDVNLAFNVGDGAGRHVDPIDPRTGRAMTHEAWQRYFAEFMEQLRAELPESAEIVHNQVYFHVGLSSPYVRRAIDAATHIEIERGVNDTGIRGGAGTFGFETVLAWIDYAHSRGKGVIYDVQASWGREYALATYFLNSNGRDGIGMDAGGLPDDWWGGWETDLGAPLGGRYSWNGVFRRDFERGSVFVNQPDQPARTLTPGGAWRGLDGAAVTTIDLPAREGAVLLRDGASPPPPPPPPPEPPAPDPRTDLAQDRPSSSSSVEHQVLAPDKAVDGSGETRFGSAWRDGEWWQVDLGETKLVSEAEVAWEAAYASSYRILTSTDGESWNEAAAVSLSRATTKATSFEPREARYVRVVGVERATEYGISFWEVRVYGQDVPSRPGPTPPADAPRPAGYSAPVYIAPAASGPAPRVSAPGRTRALRRKAMSRRRALARRRAALRCRSAKRRNWTFVRCPRKGASKRVRRSDS